MYIYKLTNRANGKAYIGATVQGVHRRLVEHRHQAKAGDKFAISEAIREFGMEAFDIAILKEAGSYEELMQLEMEAIEEFQTMEPNGYNRTRGGRGTLGHQKSEAGRLALSVKGKGRILSDSHREAIRLAQLGNDHAKGKSHPGWRGTHTAETKAKMSASKIGGKNWNARAVEINGKAYPSSTEAGQELGLTRDEVRELVRKGLARYLDPSKYAGAPRKVREAWNKGVPRTEEEKAKMRATHLSKLNPRCRAIEIDGITYPSVAQAARDSGLSYGQVWHRIHTGRARYLNPPPGGKPQKDNLTP